MLELLLALFVLALLGLVRQTRAEPRAAQPEAVAPAARPRAEAWTGSGSLGPRAWMPWACGVAVALALALTGALGGALALAAGALSAAVLVVVRRERHARRRIRVELQLADAIDLAVGSLRAGGSLTEALTSAAAESRAPFRRYVDELVHRVRLGDDPLVVLAELEARVPLESFRLFSFTLAAHWQGGGSLASTLATVGRTIRDRVAVTRRVRSQAMESQVSAVGVLVVTYLLAWMMWRTYPARMETFFGTQVGAVLVAAAVALQALGLLWISRMTRIET